MTDEDAFREELKPRENPEGLSSFEIKAMKWRATEDILATAREAEERYGLHPDLLDAVENAVRGGDADEIAGAVADIMHAVMEARENL